MTLTEQASAEDLAWMAARLRLIADEVERGSFNGTLKVSNNGYSETRQFENGKTERRLTSEDHYLIDVKVLVPGEWA